MTDGFYWWNWINSYFSLSCFFVVILFSTGNDDCFLPPQSELRWLIGLFNAELAEPKISSPFFFALLFFLEIRFRSRLPVVMIAFTAPVWFYKHDWLVQIQYWTLHFVFMVGKKNILIFMVMMIVFYRPSLNYDDWLVLSMLNTINICESILFYLLFNYLFA